ncbi:hypothetical protein ACFQ44_13645 [Levilactobacillus lanxiensis]|uniref:Uncharacterized protein n=1 Tax=Levilactobacillus lanxiensis TaxID=2799568 RepID=A0ABW4D924_9LACO|nr:hypothetical protein [Levilactobacillus lanxiensis]
MGGKEDAIFTRVTFIFVANGITDVQIIFPLILGHSDSLSVSWCPGLEGDLADYFLRVLANR